MNGAQPYRVPRHPAPIELALASNEGARPPAALRGADGDPAAAEQLRRYPDASQLEAAIAARLALDPANVLVTAGADDGLFRAVAACFSDPVRDSAGVRDELILPRPTFEMIERYGRLFGARIVAVDWPEGEFPVDRVLARVSERTRAVVVVSPQNPTGACCSPGALAELVEALPEGVRLIVDQAYAEYADADLTEAALRMPNAVVVRTFSKAWGLAGLRVGYALGAPEALCELRAVGQPYAVASSSLALVQRALEEGGSWVAPHVAQVRSERQQLQRELAELGLRPRPSQANFVLVELSSARAAGWLADALAGLGVAVRRFAGADEPRGLGRCVRIGCPGDARAQQQLCSALRTALRPEALLFDLDGVLADTSRSYRAAIVETAASFGATIRPADIAAAKAAGSANDDHDLTRRLLERAGVDVALGEVVERFERLYQGDGQRVGLWRNEQLLVARAALERLAARYPLAIVTGRPRRDAQRFIEGHELGSLFSAVVCREDAPLKPNPAPVSLALERLGVERGWMMGDTPDDVRAARGAGVLPIGSVAPGDDPERAGEALLSAGAARALTRADELFELLEVIS